MDLLLRKKKTLVLRAILVRLFVRLHFDCLQFLFRFFFANRYQKLERLIYRTMTQVMSQYGNRTDFNCKPCDESMCSPLSALSVHDMFAVHYSYSYGATPPAWTVTANPSVSNPMEQSIQLPVAAAADIFGTITPQVGENVVFANSVPAGATTFTNYVPDVIFTPLWVIGALPTVENGNVYILNPKLVSRLWRSDDGIYTVYGTNAGGRKILNINMGMFPAMQIWLSDVFMQSVERVQGICITRSKRRANRCNLPRAEFSEGSDCEPSSDCSSSSSSSCSSSSSSSDDCESESCPSVGFDECSYSDRRYGRYGRQSKRR